MWSQMLSPSSMPDSVPGEATDSPAASASVLQPLQSLQPGHLQPFCTRWEQHMLDGEALPVTGVPLLGQQVSVKGSGYYSAKHTRFRRGCAARKRTGTPGPLPLGHLLGHRPPVPSSCRRGEGDKGIQHLAERTMKPAGPACPVSVCSTHLLCPLPVRAPGAARPLRWANPPSPRSCVACSSAYGSSSWAALSNLSSRPACHQGETGLGFHVSSLRLITKCPAQVSRALSLARFGFPAPPCAFARLSPSFSACS